MAFSFYRMYRLNLISRGFDCLLVKLYNLTPSKSVPSSRPGMEVELDFRFQIMKSRCWSTTTNHEWEAVDNPKLGGMWSRLHKFILIRLGWVQRNIWSIGYQDRTKVACQATLNQTCSMKLPYEPQPYFKPSQPA